MKFKLFIVIMMAISGVSLGSRIDLYAEENPIRKEGAYQVVEGNVGSLQARTLQIDGQQYPVSIYARVFDSALNGREMKLQDLVNVGRIDRAKLYLIGGKVEKIVVLKNL